MSELNRGNVRVVTHLFKNTNVDPHHSIEVDVHLPPGKSSHLVTKTVIICYYIVKQDALGKQKCLMVSKRIFAVMMKKKREMAIRPHLAATLPMHNITDFSMYTSGMGCKEQASLCTNSLTPPFLCTFPFSFFLYLSVSQTKDYKVVNRTRDEKDRKKPVSYYFKFYLCSKVFQNQRYIGDTMRQLNSNAIVIKYLVSELVYPGQGHD